MVSLAVSTCVRSFQNNLHFIGMGESIHCPPQDPPSTDHASPCRPPSPIASILSSVSRHSIQSVVGRRSTDGRTETVSSLENLFAVRWRRRRTRTRPLIVTGNGRYPPKVRFWAEGNRSKKNPHPVPPSRRTTSDDSGGVADRS